MSTKAKKIIDDTILNSKDFTMFIEQQVSKSGCDILDALVTYAEKNNIEIETVAGLVKNSHVLKARLAAESEKYNLLKEKSGNKLPI